MSDCPVNTGVETVSQWAACLRRAAGPAISSIDPTHPAYMNTPTTGPSVAVWVIVGIVAAVFVIVSLSRLLATGGHRPNVKLNPMRPRTGPYASVETPDGTVWARTKPASMRGGTP
jgi:hypothetical protein